MNAENTSLHNSHISLHKPVFINLESIAAIALFFVGLSVSGFALAFALSGLIVAIFYLERKRQAAIEATARAAAWVNIIGPVVIASMHPGETAQEVHERAEYFRAQLFLSGNPYADKIPVIEMPYTPILVDHGQLPAAWSIYQKSVGERQHLENLHWYERGCPNQLKTLFASAVLPAPKMTEL